MLFFDRFVWNIIRIFRKINKNPLQKNKRFTTVLLSLPTVPHTFWKYIFLNKENFENKVIPQEVLWHEETHARELHSIDILLVAFLQVVFWFNPLLYYFKNAMKLNHEFLADQSVLKKGVNTTFYQTILLAFSSNAQVPALAHAIHYSFIKKRFTVMKTKTSKRSTWLRILFIAPLLAIVLYSFSTKEIIQKPVATETISQTEKATKEELNTYNQLAKLYNQQPQAIRTIPLSDLQILESIYQKMTQEQKEQSLPFPNCPIKEKTITIKIIGDNVIVNDKATTLEHFAKEVNAITSDWKEKDFINATLEVIINKSSETFMAKLEEEFKKTDLYRRSPDKKRLIPPPPPKPDGVEMTIEKIDHIETPVPTKEDEIEFYNEFLGPDAPPPPPVPEAPNTLDFVIDIAKKGAIFYLDGSKISSDKAIETVKKNRKINIQSNDDEKVPVVKLYTKPIQLSPKSNGGTQTYTPKKTSPVEQIRELTKKGAAFYWGPHRITPKEAMELAEKNPDLILEIDDKTYLYPVVTINGC
ncbi:MAG: M56 family metallopeptidase [Flavobacteriaceae bacterium]